MDDSWNAAFSIALFIWAITATALLLSNNNARETMIRQCEVMLPRDQHCVIIAVPIEPDTE